MDELMDVVYDSGKTKELLQELKEIGMGILKFVPEEIDFKKNENSDMKKSIIQQFYIGNEMQPEFMMVKDMKQLDIILKNFNDGIECFIDNLELICEKNSDMSKSEAETLLIFQKVIERAQVVFQKQCLGIKRKLSEQSTVDEIQQKLESVLPKILGEYIIHPIVSPVYEALSKKTNRIYEQILYELNTFLKRNGVYTVLISEGDIVDPHIVEFTEESINCITNNYKQADTIKEVKRLPYAFSKDKILLPGIVNAWRLEG